MALYRQCLRLTAGGASGVERRRDAVSERAIPAGQLRGRGAESCCDALSNSNVAELEPILSIVV